MRGLSFDLSSVSLPHVYSTLCFSFFFLSTRLRNSRGPPEASPHYCPVRSSSRSPSCFVPSVPGAQCDIYGFLLGALCRSRHYTKERERFSSPRLRPSSCLGIGYRPEVCSSQKRQAATDDDDDDDGNGRRRRRRRRQRRRRGRRARTSAALLGLFFSVFPFFFKKENIRASCALESEERRGMKEKEGGRVRVPHSYRISSWAIHGGTRSRKGWKGNGGYRRLSSRRPFEPFFRQRATKERKNLERTEAAALSVHENSPLPPASSSLRLKQPNYCPIDIDFSDRITPRSLGSPQRGPDARKTLSDSRLGRGRSLLQLWGILIHLIVPRDKRLWSKCNNSFMCT